MILTVLHTLGAAALVLSIAVQYNDPDPLLWMAIYAVPLPVVLLGLFRQYTVAAALLMGLYFAGGLAWMPWDNLAEAAGVRPQWKMMSPENEQFREAGGLLVTALILAVPAWCWWNEDRAHRDLEDITDLADPF